MGWVGGVSSKVVLSGALYGGNKVYLGIEYVPEAGYNLSQKSGRKALREHNQFRTT